MGADGEFVVNDGSDASIMPSKPSNDEDKPITTITKDMNEDEPKEITDEDENDKIPARMDYNIIIHILI
jgi:hypothetical protein